MKNNLDAYRGAYPTRHPILFGLVFGPYVKDVTADDASSTVTVTVDGDPNTPGNQGWSAFDSYLFSSGRLGIMAQAQLDDASGCAKNLIGTGPFKLKEWVVNDHFTAVKNPDYWGTDPGNGNAKLPYLDQITFKPVPDGQQRLNGLESGQFQATYTTSNILTGADAGPRAAGHDQGVRSGQVHDDEPPDVVHRPADGHDVSG